MTVKLTRAGTRARTIAIGDRRAGTRARTIAIGDHNTC